MVCHYVVETSRDRGRNNSPGNKNLSFFHLIFAVLVTMSNRIIHNQLY